MKKIDMEAVKEITERIKNSTDEKEERALRNLRRKMLRKGVAEVGDRIQ